MSSNPAAAAPDAPPARMPRPGVAIGSTVGSSAAITASSLGSAEVEPPLSEAAAEAWIPRTCFKNGPPSRIGVELEMLVADARLPDGVATHVPPHRHEALVRDLQSVRLDGRLTIEPGGQVELSSRPGSTLPQTVNTVQRDLAALRRRAARHSVRLIGLGAEPSCPPHRIDEHPRYVAMERYLDRWGPAGRTMMCSTASVQVNVEAAVDTVAPAGPVRLLQDRWDLLHAIGPALVAAFANSPRLSGRPTGWKSTRQRAWLRLDPARTAAPKQAPGEDLPAAWTRWVLDAPLMVVRRDSAPWTAPEGVTFRDWLRAGTAVIPDRTPDLDDLAYHLTTLFPPVRARGHLEVRFIDAQPGQWWTVPVATIGALLDDAAAADLARNACAPIEGRWRDAAKSGLDDPDLARAAIAVLQTAAAALGSAPDTAQLAGQLYGYLERWTARGRCPADDPPDRLHSLGDPPTISRCEPWGDDPA